MEKNNNGVSEMQRTLTDSLQRMTDLSMETMKPLVENMFGSLSQMNKRMVDGKMPTLNLSNMTFKTNSCYPPEQTCPPHCIAAITKHAIAGERIVVPFIVKNECFLTKTYRIGVRELKDIDGKLAPSEPTLSKSVVTLEPGRSERVSLSIDLVRYSNGTEYMTEIVLRENEFNQNICFRLIVNFYGEITAIPFSESKYKTKWQGWQSHFYCEPKKKKGLNATGSVIAIK